MGNYEKYAVVTGASSGIGWHISEELAYRGYSIVAVSNQLPQLQVLKTTLERNYPIKVLTLATDLSLEDSAISVYNFCKDNNLLVEVLVNDAGMFFFGEVTKIDLKSVRTILSLHMVTPVLLCRLFGEQMASRSMGYILNLSSITAVMPYPGISLYAPTKAFIRHFSKAFRSEMKLDNVSVTCLIPGAAETSLYDHGNINTALLKKLGIMKKPEAIAKSGVRALFRGRAVCVPGFINKITVLFFPLVPRYIIEFLTRKTDLIRKKDKLPDL